jgi:polyisoprenoid-binding protein YceI
MDIDGDGEPVFGEPAVGKLSLAVNRLASGNVLEDRELQRRIDAKRFPTIDGLLTGAERVDGTARHRVRGDLAFRGVAREVRDELSVEVVDDRTLRLAGQTTFDIRDFGMEPPKILLLKVEPEVVVRIEVIAELED